MSDLFENPAGKNKQETGKPHYHGHRQRMRQKFLEKGAESLADYELLELLLFTAIPRRDVKPLAKDLLGKFGSLNAVINARPDDLLQFKGLSESSVAAIKIVQAAASRMLKQDITRQPILNNWSRILDYCYATMAYETREHFRILFLNKKNYLIADETQQTGTVDHTPAYPREIIKRALELDATALILVHNHPSGDPTPSDTDIDMTMAIMAAGEPFDIIIHDHLIVSRNGVKSFKSLNLIS